jgi:hypothetical protein
VSIGPLTQMTKLSKYWDDRLMGAEIAKSTSKVLYHPTDRYSSFYMCRTVTEEHVVATLAQYCVPHPVSKAQ